MSEAPKFISYRRVTPELVGELAGLTFPAYRRQWLAGAPMLGVAAYWGETPLGLGLAAMPNGSHVEVLSLYVDVARRSQGLGSALLGKLEEALVAVGARVATCTYTVGSDNTAAVERVLAKAGWAPPVARMLIFQGRLEDMRAARWVRNAQLGEDFELVPWRDVSETERETLRVWQEADDWIPEDLAPWVHEAGYEPETSLGLRLNGRIVGWVLTHRLERDLLRFSTGWVHPELQRRGRLFALYAAAGERALSQGYERASWTVPLHHVSKAAFAKRWMVQVAKCRETRGSAKLLLVNEPPEDGPEY